MLNQFALTYLAPVTVCLVALMLSMSLYAYYVNGDLFSTFIFSPSTLSKNKRYFSFLSSALLHGDLLHLGINAFTFYIYGSLLERIVGSGLFLGLILVMQLLINFILFLIYRSSAKFFSLGAGGIIVFALTCSLLLIKWNYRLIFLPFTLYAFVIPILYFAFLYFIIYTRRDNVNHETTLIGVLTGLLFALLIYPLLGHP